MQLESDDSGYTTDPLDVDKTDDKKYIDTSMVAQIESTSHGVHDVFTEDRMEDDYHLNPNTIAFTQMMGNAEGEVADFFERGFILANLDSDLTSMIARVLVATRYTLYVSLCIMVGALTTAVGMVLDRIVIGILTKKFEITVGKKGTIAFLIIFGVLGMGCTCLLAYWFYQGPVWLPCALIAVLLAAMFALHKSSKGKKWFEEMIECLYLIVAPKLFVWKYILAAIGKDKIAFPYDV